MNREEDSDPSVADCCDTSPKTGRGYLKETA